MGKLTKDECGRLAILRGHQTAKRGLGAVNNPYYGNSRLSKLWRNGFDEYEHKGKANDQ